MQKISMLRNLGLIALVAALFCPLVAATASAKGSSSRKAFTLVMLPDTQFYADVRIKLAQKKYKISDQRFCFFAQTEWIKENREKLNIVMVAHLGDVVQTDYPAEWEIADKAFKTLDDSVPYILNQGNHDMGYAKNKTATSRETNMDKYFPPSRFEKNPLYSYGGNFNKSSANAYLKFSAGGMEFLILSLEFKPRDEVLEWANDVIAKHPKHRSIIVTHYYLTNAGKRQSRIGYNVQGNSGEEIWKKFVSKHKNIFMVLCGHTCPNARLTSRGEKGNEVHQLLADFQNEKGGQGYLQTITFQPEKNQINVSTYSPVLKSYRKDPRNQFSLKYDMHTK